MASARNIALYEELVKEAEAKVADTSALKLLLAGLVGGAAVGIPAHLLTKAHEAKKRVQTRNHAFGAGMATGIATPKLLRGLLNIAQRSGLVAPEGAM